MCTWRLHLLLLVSCFVQNCDKALWYPLTAMSSLTILTGPIIFGIDFWYLGRSTAIHRWHFSEMKFFPIHCTKHLNCGLHTSRAPLNVYVAHICLPFIPLTLGDSLLCLTNNIELDKLKSQPKQRFLFAHWMFVAKIYGAYGHGFVRTVNDIPHKLCGMSLTFLTNENFPYIALKN